MQSTTSKSERKNQKVHHNPAIYTIHYHQMDIPARAQTLNHKEHAIEQTFNANRRTHPVETITLAHLVERREESDNICENRGILKL
ncbi:hypothetical protein DID88_006065 [Monilinia fructigena]|uniref:Uncharacterized protein n=1 Tax=Monilinia fructigena TaxID=38457 RepID=A0A395IDD1_9HELO|nr:hypothetical protein DID88_006065 [Monilinia fructigena]